MEESARRRERLKAMRMEASQEVATDNDGNEHSAGVSHGLSNPLLESTANPGGHLDSSTPSQSFNFYTDPMAAFSANKQRSKVSPQISQDFSSPPPRSWTYETSPSPALQPHINPSPDQRMNQPHGQYAPKGGNFTNPNYSGGYPGSGRVSYPSPGPQFGNSPGRGSGQGGYPSPSPHFTNTPAYGSSRGNYPSPSPHFRNSPTHGSGQGSYPNPQFSNSPSHGSGQGGYLSSGPNQGRGRWFGRSGSAGSSGRGRGGRGVQGRGAHNHVSAEDRPDLFYNKSMVEDPWKFLEPVVWRSQKKSWFPNSNVKRAKVSESPRQQQSSSQPSLAEILAASFNEAVSDEP